MSWIKKILPVLKRSDSKASPVPEGLWQSCGECHTYLYRPELEKNLWVCVGCGHHFPVKARWRLMHFLDEGTAQECAAEVGIRDPLRFKDTRKYSDRLKEAVEKTGEQEALVVMQGNLKGRRVVACAFEFNFMGGSMGTAVGERFVRGIEAAIELKCPFICFTASGGARMQEGLLALFQMAKTSMAIAQLGRQRLPYVTVLTHPTMGGVSASLAMLGDIILAEPNALIGFAGPRVIEQTVRERLPEGFQRSEFLLAHGAIDALCDRRQQRDYLRQVLGMLMHWEPTGAA